MRDELPFEKAEVERSIGDRFDRIVRRFPDSPAVSESGRVTTYADLDAAARRYAGALSARLARVPGPIALMLDPGAPLFAAMLGGLKAGRFYVPLDPVLPAARLAAVLRELDAMARYELHPERFRAWNTPTLLLLGGESPPVYRAGIERMQAILPGSTIAVLEGQGHMAMKTAPKLFVREILEFLKEDKART